VVRRAYPRRLGLWPRFFLNFALDQNQAFELAQRLYVSANDIASSVGRQIVRGVLGSLLGGSSKR
jgi:hypothetical protein